MITFMKLHQKIICEIGQCRVIKAMQNFTNENEYSASHFYKTCLILQYSIYLVHYLCSFGVLSLTSGCKNVIFNTETDEIVGIGAFQQPINHWLNKLDYCSLMFLKNFWKNMQEYKI